MKPSACWEGSSAAPPPTQGRAEWRFCRRIGRETNQGEVGLVIGDEYVAIRNLDEE